MPVVPECVRKTGSQRKDSAGNWSVTVTGLWRRCLTLKFNILSRTEVRKIVTAAIDILERTGVEIDHPQAVRMLMRAGCSQDGSGRVRIPFQLVQESIDVAPKSISVANRKGALAMVLEGRRSYFGSQIGCPNILDPYTGMRRPFMRKDAAHSARVTDFLPNIDFMVIGGRLFGTHL